ncbi:MAG: RluA family pseudouridine synthase [Syntrophales bacterium]|jgi:23S rRNA pseudouridine1911/1915/1917 synthase|nr:RluA family pseudouridine synthase [Syntrophales bacterium]MDY0043321.1 RluA family pseudouridine synthase [Syntrophales bacterium]
MIFSKGESRFFNVSEKEKGIRLDLFLAERNSDLSRSQIKKAIEKARVTVNHGNVKPGHHLKTGDMVFLRIAQPEPAGIKPEDIPLSVIFEDEFLIVIDKPHGMVVHPGAGNPCGTLVNALLAHCKDLSGIGGYLRPGIVHRLDKDTSGLMVAAKSDHVHRLLADQFKYRKVTKVYQTIAFGTFDHKEGIIDAPIGRHPTDRKKMSPSGKRGKNALTKWMVKEQFNGVAFLNVQIETGRTHQIRVHLSSIGHPVVADTEYGGTKKRTCAIADQKVRQALLTLNRQALHAGYLKFFHPCREMTMEFTAPLSADMELVLEKLRREIP